MSGMSSDLRGMIEQANRVKAFLDSIPYGLDARRDGKPGIVYSDLARAKDRLGTVIDGLTRAANAVQTAPRSGPANYEPTHGHLNEHRTRYDR